MKRLFPQMLGNESLCHRLGREFGSGKHAHAYILAGEKGSGKHTLARLIAMAVSCENRGDPDGDLPCGTCRSCRKILSGNAPDLVTVSKPADKATMGIEVIRDLRSGLHVLPNDTDVRVYVIEEAHLMTPAAQNAFLLTLEEPPSFVLFLLLTESADALLETVRSRAPIFRMQPLSSQTIREKLLADYPAARTMLRDEPENFEAMLLLSAGLLGRAIALLDAGERETLLAERAEVVSLVRVLADGRDSARILLTLRDIGVSRKRLLSGLLLLELALRDLLALGQDENAVRIFYTEGESALELSERFSAARLLYYLKEIGEAKQALSQNANTNLVLAKLTARLSVYRG